MAASTAQLGGQASYVGIRATTERWSGGSPDEPPPNAQPILRLLRPLTSLAVHLEYGKPELGSEAPFCTKVLCF